MPKPPKQYYNIKRLARIAGHFDGCKKSRNGYTAHCPLHDDSTPSLSINLGRDGKVLIHCFADCPPHAVLHVVGLRMSDLTPDTNRIVAEYDYRDESGKLISQVVRFESKQIAQRKPNGAGGWDWTTNGCRRVLYRLPELLAADASEPVFVVEGEKDAERLASMGLIATTNIGGAGKWRDEYNTYFKGRFVVVLPDNDHAGRDHAEHVGGSLYNVASVVKIVDLPGLAAKGDVSDWMDAGGTKKKLLALVKKTAIRVIKIIKSRVQESQESDDNRIIKIAPPVLGEAVYYGFVGKFLKAVAPFTEATDAGILAHLLPAVGTLIGPGPYVYTGAPQPARIFSAVVGETNSGRKGTSRGPIDLLMNKVDRKFWRLQGRGGLSSGEGLIVKVTDIRKKDKDGNLEIIPAEKRQFIVEPEFSRALASISREGNTLSQVMRESFDSGNLETLTVNPRQATGAHISIVVHITPEELLAGFKKVQMQNGFGNRFLWFLVKSVKIMPRTKPIPPDVLDPFIPILRSLKKYGKTSIELSIVAQNKWDSVYPLLREDRPGLAGKMTCRGHVFILRLALIYALLDERKDKVIRVKHLEAAQEVWRYCQQSAEILFAGKTGEELSDKVLRLLDDGPMTKTDFNKHLSIDQKKNIDDALTRLEAVKLVRSETIKRKGAGRPATSWSKV